MPFPLGNAAVAWMGRLGAAAPKSAAQIRAGWCKARLPRVGVGIQPTPSPVCSWARLLPSLTRFPCHPPMSLSPPRRPNSQAHGGNLASMGWQPPVHGQPTQDSALTCLTARLRHPEAGLRDLRRPRVHSGLRSQPNRKWCLPPA